MQEGVGTLTNTSPRHRSTREAEGLPQRLAGSLWVERLARLGYAAKGLLYVIAGCTLVFAAIGFGGRAVGLRGALRFVIAQPFGRLTVGLVALGLAGFILRRVVQVCVPPVGQPKLAVMRILRPLGYALSGLGNVGVALTALQLVLGWPVQNPRDRVSTLDWTVPLVTATPFRTWLVFGVGLGLVGFALFHLYMAVTARFQIDLEVERMTTRTRKLTFACGRGGYAALGFAFLIAGGTIAYAGWLADIREVTGVGAALQRIETLPFGTVLLIAVAIGVIAHGLYLVFVARYLRLIATW
jgi:hypothetical protein